MKRKDKQSDDIEMQQDVDIKQETEETQEEEARKAASPEERREARRKRRIRNQILAYLTMLVMIAVLAVGVVYGVKYLTDAAKAKEQQKQEQVEELFVEEEDIPEPTAAPVEEEEPVPELTEQEKLDMIVDARIEVMPLEDKVAGLFIVTPESITGVDTAIKAGDGTKEALTQYAVGGIIYSEKNIKDEAQFREMVENTKLYASYPLFVAMEDEGGKNSPLAQAKLVDETSGAATIAETGDVSKAYEAGTAIGTALADYGFNLDLAPVADLNSVEDSVIGSRAFSSDAALASPFVSAMVQGLRERNVATCLKHFPGMGSTSQDTAKGLAASERSAEDFRSNEFAVFLAGIAAGADMVMVSNMSANSLSGDDMPCSMSPAVVTDILRNELNFRGVIITESMSKKAISEYYGADEAAVRALRAGCDMILMPEDFEKAYNGVLDAVRGGEIAEERIDDALRRIYRIKDADKLEE